MQTQIDIFGNEIPTDQAFADKPRETIHSRWRKMYGVNAYHRCGECEYCEGRQSGRRVHYKCILMGVSASEATDIRLRNPSCQRFKAKQEENTDE